MFVLISDLDGTFLGGEKTHYLRLTKFIADERHARKLVYCTGRAREKVLPLIESGLLPRPDAIIGDVGTSLWDGYGGPLAPEIEESIRFRWQNSGSRVIRALSSIDDLKPQEGCGPNRMSFTYTQHGTVELATHIVKAMGFDALHSDGRYFDVLPAGINKGATVRELVKLWNLDESQVVVAGDTLNDLSMFETGLQGIVVGNAEPALIAALPSGSKTYCAKNHGAGGILEGLRHFGFA